MALADDWVEDPMGGGLETYEQMLELDEGVVRPGLTPRTMAEQTSLVTLTRSAPHRRQLTP